MMWFSYYLLIGVPFGIYGGIKFLKQARLLGGFDPNSLMIVKRLLYYILVFAGCYVLYPLVIMDIIIDIRKLRKLKQEEIKK